MSFAYKKISPSNITVSKNKVNKNYQFDSLVDDNINIFVGENIPLSEIDLFQKYEYDIESLIPINEFDPFNDDRTTNNEYRRLIFESIKHLFFHDYIGNSGELISPSGSRYEHYHQTPLYSGSYSTSLRYLNNISGSSFQSIINNYNEGVVYDDIYLYDDAIFDSNRGNTIVVISVNKNIYGNSIKRNSIKFIKDLSYIRDDGYGNLFDYGNETNYNTFLNDGIINGILIGNILYSHGLLIITNNEYNCLFSTPIIAINDIYTFINTEVPDTLDIYSNDYSDCNNIDYSNFELIPILGESFPDSYLDNNYLNLINNQTRYIPGIYKINYKIYNTEGISSNDALITLNILSQDLLENTTINKICSGSIINNSFTCSISGGVPIYSYSFNNMDYIPLSGFNNVIFSGSYNTTSSFLYIKDYIGNVVSSSLYPYYDYEYIINSIPGPSCNNSGSIILSSIEGLTFNIDSDPTEYNENITYTFPVGTYDMYITTPQGCIITESINITTEESMSINIITESINCYGGNGNIIINPIVGGELPYNILFNSSSYNITSSTSFIIEDIPSGSYPISIMDGNGCSYTSSIEFISPTPLSMSITELYNAACYTTIEITGSGGSGNYEFFVNGPNGVYFTNNNTIPLTLDLNQTNEFIITCSIEDDLGCVNTIYHTIPGRIWEYSGSYCEQN